MEIDRPFHLNITINHDNGYVTMERFRSIWGHDKEVACVHVARPSVPVPTFHGIPIEYIEEIG